MDGSVTPQASLEESVERLSIQDKKPEPDISRLLVKKTAARASKKKEAAVVADSWEDELSDSGSETETGEDTTSAVPTASKAGMNSPSSMSEGPLAPPPTPATDNGEFVPQWSPRAQGAAAPPKETPRIRPEKQTAVASRMIAGALGIRAPKRTEEQRAYDRAVKEKEMKRRNKAKEEAARAQQEEEKARSAVWDD